MNNMLCDITNKIGVNWQHIATCTYFSNLAEGYKLGCFTSIAIGLSTRLDNVAPQMWFLFLDNCEIVCGLCSKSGG